jgi:DNA-binding NarL/FixJ family response regulator
MTARSTKKAAGGALPKRILLVDDHPLIREGLRGTIQRQPDLVVCGEADSASNAISMFASLKPDLALVDISLPGKSGLELIKELKYLDPRCAILAISMHDESLYAQRALKAGASGYITKQETPAELIRALRQVLEGRHYVSAQVADQIIDQFSGRPVVAKGRISIDMLSDRELEIFELIGDGKTAKQIAQLLHLSPKTVAVHAANIRHKLGVQTTGQLIRLVVRWQQAKSLDNI